MDTEENFIGRTDIAAKIASGELLLFDKTTSRGRIWRIFARVTNREGVELDFVCCKSCERVYKYNHSQTSNLCRHSCYVDKFANAENTISSLEEEKPKIQICELTVNNLTQLLAKWIIHDCHSYDVIQSEGLKAVFQELLQLGAKFGCDPDVSKFLPSRSATCNNISAIYNRLHVSIKEELSPVKENGFGLIADILTDSVSKENYIALTVHYLKDSVLIHRLLGFHILEGVSFTTGATSIKHILQEFDLQLSRKCLVVTDGSFDFNTSFPDAQTLPCLSQLLNNAILEAVERTPQISQTINSYFKLLSQQRHHNRSLTICKLLNSILIHLHEIEQELQDMQESHIFSLNKSELMAILSVLQPFEDAIETLENDSQATLHLVVAYMHELRKFYSTSTHDHTRFTCVKQLQENILAELEQIVRKNSKTLHKLAVFLYPPTNKLLPYSDKEKTFIENECIRLLNYYKIETKISIKREPDEQPALALACKRRKLLADFLESETVYDTNETIRQEIQNYKNTRVVFSSNFNVFNWWELQKDNFPLLYKLSCSILATPATSSTTKRLFANATSLLSERYKQNSTTDADIEKIMFIGANAPGIELDRYFTG